MGIKRGLLWIDFGSLFDIGPVETKLQNTIRLQRVTYICREDDVYIGSTFYNYKIPRLCDKIFLYKGFSLDFSIVFERFST